MTTIRDNNNKKKFLLESNTSIQESFVTAARVLGSFYKNVLSSNATSVAQYQESNESIHNGNLGETPSFWLLLDSWNLPTSPFASHCNVNGHHHHASWGIIIVIGQCHWACSSPAYTGALSPDNHSFLLHGFLYASFSQVPQIMQKSSPLGDKKSNVSFGVASGVVAVICLHTAFCSRPAIAHNIYSFRPSFAPALFGRIPPTLVQLTYNMVI